MSSVSKPNVYNLSMPTANTEYSQALPSFCKSVRILARPDPTTGAIYDMKLAFVATESGTNYISIPGGYKEQPIPEGFVVAGVLTVYLQSPSASVVAEIFAWT